MIFIIEGKKYDTEKAEKLAVFKQPFIDYVLYKTKKGNYFLVFIPMAGKHYAMTIKKSEAKEIVEKEKPELYEELFGEIEEG